MLTDPERRQVYDSYGHEGLKSGGYAPNFGDFGSISDLFSAFFGAGGFDAAFGGARARGGPVQGGDVAVAVAIELVEAAHGHQVEVDLRRAGALRDLQRQRRQAGDADRDVPALPGRGPAAGGLPHAASGR